MRLTTTWRCLGDGRTPCDAHGEGDRADREAEKHTNTAKHGTVTTGSPETAREGTASATESHGRPNTPPGKSKPSQRPQEARP